MQAIDRNVKRSGHLLENILYPTKSAEQDYNLEVHSDQIVHPYTI